MDVLVLGPVGVGPVGQPTTPTSNILRAVLAALALAGPGGLSGGELFETVWGSRDARSMDSTLTVNIHRLRQWLRATTGGRVSITRTTNGYALDLSEGEVDADRFVRLAEAAEALEPAEKAEALGAALALWRGPALADVPDGSADQLAVTRLELRRVTAVVDFAGALVGSGQAEQAIHALSPLVEDHPLDERVVGAWIEALAATGRRADALDAYERLRLRLRDEMGADPGRALSQVLTRVLRQESPAPAEVSVPVVSEPQQPTVRTDLLVPAQLPADTYVFTGRSAALSRLDILKRGTSAASTATGTGPQYHIALVTGAGGIGKTSLAVHWAHRASAHFPDGQLYANLHGFSGAPPERPVDVLGRFLRALGVSGSGVPVDPEEAGALYRSLLVNRRVLVVLDNAVDAAQVRPLLPGAESSRVLITSRDRLDGLVALDGAQPIGLDVLSERESVELLARVLGEARVAGEPEAVRQVVLACAGLPLALRIAAAQLVIRPDRSIGRFVAQLTGGERLDSLAIGGDSSSQLRAVFDLSYVRLDAEARRLFRIVGALPEVDLTVQSAAALLRVGQDEAADVLDRLASAHLITAHLPGRYECHDLLRDYAGELARAEDDHCARTAAFARLAAWYEAGTERAVDRVYPDRDRLPGTGDEDERVTRGGFADRFDEESEAMGWLRVEHRNLLAVIAHAADHGPRTAAWRTTWLLRPHFYAAELHSDWFAVVCCAERALAVDGERQGDPLGEAALNLMLGDVAQLRSDIDASSAHFKRAHDASHAVGWPAGAATALLRLGLSHFDRGELDSARACFRRSFDLYDSCGQKYGEARAGGNLGLVYCETGPLDEAVRLLGLYHESRAVFGFTRARAQSMCGLGYANFHAGNYDESLRLLDAALELAESNGETRTARLAHCDLVALHCVRGDFEKARYHAALADSLGSQAGTPRAVTQTAFAWGLIFEGERDYKRALEYYDDVLRKAIGFGDSDHELCALIGCASARRSLGDLDDSLHHAQQALAISHERGCRVFEVQALAELAETNLALGNVDRARQHAERAVALGLETKYPIGRAKALRALGDAVRRADGQEAAMPHWLAARDLYAGLGSPEAKSLLAERIGAGVPASASAASGAGTGAGAAAVNGVGGERTVPIRVSPHAGPTGRPSPRGPH